MPLNTTNLRDVTDEAVGADDVLLSVRPSTRAAREDWDTQFQRAPDDGTGNPSTDDWRTIQTVPAGQRVVKDRAVQSTTSPFFWRARHVRPGSTEGPWTDAKGGKPREDADSAIHSSLNVAQLDVITNDIGKLTAGTLANTTGTRFINLSATGNNDFIHVEDASGTTTLSIQADGDADFGGTVSSSQFTSNRILTGVGGNQQIRILPGATNMRLDYSFGASADKVFRTEYDSAADKTFIGTTIQTDIEIDSQTRVNVNASTRISLTVGGGLNAGGITVRSATNLVLNPADKVSFEGDNLSTGSGAANEFLTLETTAGTRKVQLYDT